MAKSLKKLAFDKVNWTNTFKNFNRLSKDNRLGFLTVIEKEIGNGKFLGIGKVAAPVDPENPPVLPPWVWPYVMVNGRLVIIFIRGPKRKKIPGIGPKVKDVQDLISSVITAKDVQFERFASNGVQHLVVKNANTQLEFMALPE
jgi:hypothetical protein